MNMRNVHIYPTEFKHESRILKETRSIIKLNLASEIFILAIASPGYPKVEVLTDKITVYRIRLLFKPWEISSKILKSLFYLELYIRIFFFLLPKKFEILNCHSLMMLPISVCLKFTKKVRIIYDPHELETERRGLEGLEKKISRYIERRLIRNVSSIIVVGPRIKDWYAQTYNLNNVFVVRNIPERSMTFFEKNSIIREKLNIPLDHPIFIYQGILTSGRGIEITLEAFKDLSEKHVVFMGSGPMKEMVKEYEASYGNIHHIDPVKPEEIIKYTKGCDVGICLFENTCLSHYYVLPNKVFEYIKSEIPIIVSDFPELTNLLSTYNCGWIVTPSVAGLKRVIEEITTPAIGSMRHELARAGKELDWSNEEENIRRAFSQ